ncbi:MAG: hypothetical protein RMI90_03380 [Thermoguttaceae bacterium]|nr:hypothetical protein [Thermoguttaceae bacterium]
MDQWQEEEIILEERGLFIPPAIEEASQPFVGRWHRLVSQTNWEKGRIICQWRLALQQAGAPPSAYSDEAWSRLVGGVSPPHVGRLRRVYERFGQVADQYPGLYWSHFLAALDWPDAEMWLEGAVQNRWSVARMQAQRAETLGLAGSARTSSVLESQLDQETAASWEAPPTVLVPELEEIRVPGQDLTKSPLAEESAEDGFSAPQEAEELTSAAESPKPAEEAAALFADLPPMPEDVAEAFEAFKLAIVRHKLAGWQEISCRQILKILDALKRFAQSSSTE